MLDSFAPGARIYLQGSAGESAAVQRRLAESPDRLANISLLSCLVPGINEFDYAALHEDARLDTFMLPPALRPSFEAGRTRVRPISYAAIANYIDATSPDVALLHVTPPVDGRCSFGICPDFGPIVAPRAKRVIGLVNPRLPRPRTGPSIAFELFDQVLEVEEAPPLSEKPARSESVERLGARVASLIPDHGLIQTGLGQTPAAIWGCLADHRGLRVRSGMVTNGFLEAYDAGTLAPDGHLTGLAYGDAALYERMNDQAFLSFADAHETHGAGLQGVDGLHAINSALEVDLFGQVNLEWVDGRLMSGVGGAPDFSRAARLGKRGRSIVALPSTARRGAVSRIVPRLASPTVSLSRNWVDTVVTEHGIADIAELAIDARAESLVAIAAPDHRDALWETWEAMRRRM